MFLHWQSLCKIHTIQFYHYIYTAELDSENEKNTQNGALTNPTNFDLNKNGNMNLIQIEIEI